MTQEDSRHSIDALVRRRCAELGISLQAVATCAGVGRAHLYKILQGQVRDPSVRTLCRIAYALQISPAVLFRFYMDEVGKTKDLTTTVVSGFPLVTDKVVFTADVTVPDHTLVLPGERFLKVWEIQNLGEIPWQGRKMVRIDDGVIVARYQADGRLVPILDAYLTSFGKSVDVPFTPPGMRCQIQVDFEAPKENCSVASIWRMVDSEGQFCFPPQFFLQVIVTVLGY